MKITIGKSKVLVVKKDQIGSWVSGEETQEVDNFNYL